jgi:hypothetical protein
MHPVARAISRLASDTGRHAGAIRTARRHLCAGLTTVTKHMGMSSARLVALATRQMPWKTDA